MIALLLALWYAPIIPDEPAAPACVIEWRVEAVVMVDGTCDIVVIPTIVCEG
jgi:hypothetical protein